MTASNKPKNQNLNGLHDLGQITEQENPQPKALPDETAEVLRNTWWKTTRGQDIRMAYYGTRNYETPSDDAQISIDAGGFNLCMYLRSEELRRFARELCTMADHIDNAKNQFSLTTEY